MSYTSSSNINGLNLFNIDGEYHNFKIKTFSKPTYCSYCKKLLAGMINQGVRCINCRLSYHKNCIPFVTMKECCVSSKNNSITLRSAMSEKNLTDGSNSSSSGSIVSQSKQKDFANLSSDFTENSYPKEHHRFRLHNFMKPTFCNYCSSLMVGLIRQGLRCEICHESYHKRCILFIPKKCERIHLMNRKSSTENIVNVSTKDIIVQVQNLTTNEKVSEEGDKPTELEARDLENKKEAMFWSGHMVYYTNIHPKLITKYWKLDAQAIYIYKTFRSKEFSDGIKLSDIKNASLCGVHNGINDDFINDQICYFTLETTDEKYYCGLDYADVGNTMNILAGNFFNMFKMAYIPYQSITKKKIGRSLSTAINAPKYQKHKVDDDYTIYYNLLLGSGQFGNVYSCQSNENKKELAVKVIDKNALAKTNPMFADTNIFQNELTLLSSLDHPGIIKLIDLYEEKSLLYIITEKLSIDMLDYILNKEEGLLPENVAKFIVYQIVNALAKLHRNNIAHCDLKPENILLVKNTEFPQVKICDFGFAKIIGDKSMRRSIVGTPAYSPPELQGMKKCYNGSVDIWSIGVIVYVSLTGRLPFEEEYDIEEQIADQSALFPKELFNNISGEAVDLIKKLLKVKIDKRISIQKTIEMPWFDGEELYKDLCRLEDEVGLKWLTTEEQRLKWQNKTEFHLAE